MKHRKSEGFARQRIQSLRGCQRLARRLRTPWVGAVRGAAGPFRAKPP